MTRLCLCYLLLVFVKAAAAYPHAVLHAAGSLLDVNILKGHQDRALKIQGDHTGSHAQGTSVPHTKNCPKEYIPPTRLEIQEQLSKWEDEVYDVGRSNKTHTYTHRKSYCSVFKNICIDQGRFVMYNKEDVPWTGTLPSYPLYGQVVHDFPGSQGELSSGTSMPDPFFRPRTSQEAASDLAQPHFSNCTVPVVFFLSYQYNAAEMLEKLFVPLWAATQRGAWDKRYTLIFDMMGQGMPPNLKLYSAFHSNQQPVTLAEASTKGHVHQQTADHTLEGRHVRCFETLGMCRLEAHWHWMGRKPDLNTGWWDLNKGFDHPNWSAGQAFIQHYMARGWLPQVGPHFPPPIDTSELDKSEASGKRQGGRLLRVVLARRPGSGHRTVLNADEVMQWCNAWKPGLDSNASVLQAGQERMEATRKLAAGANSGGGDPRGTQGPYVGAQCVSYAFDDLLLSAALMRQTDVLLAVHGAALSNAVFMPKGAAAIEVKPLGFQGIWPNHYLRKMLTMTDKNQSVFWYGLNIVTEANSAPGLWEKTGKGPGWTYGRDRHVRIETGILQKLLDRIAGVDGDVGRYAKLADEWGHYINDDGSRPGDTMDAGLL